MRTDASPPVISILLISAAALAYEVLLMRLFSIIQWHHFAYMVISLALLGYGASGTFLTLMRQRLIPHFTLAFVLNAALFGISSMVCFLLAQELPFNTLEMFLDPGQWRYLLLSYLLLFIPFFFAANCICLSFTRFSQQIPRIYAFDLIGAGIGALGIILALYLFPPQKVLSIIASFGLLAAVLVAHRFKQAAERIMSFIGLGVVLTLTLLTQHWLKLELSEYKALNQYLEVSGTSIIEEHSSPLGLISLIESPEVPLRLVSGLSLNNQMEPPAQLGLFIDGDAPSALTRFNGELASLTYLDYQTSALPYHLTESDRVLILGLGGGNDLLQAAWHQIPEIHVVELNPQIVRLFKHSYADYVGWPWLQSNAHIHVAEARGFITESAELYDLIQISLLDAAGAAAAGVHGLSESYLYTREGIATYLQHLNPDGLLAITRWVKLPPRDGLKLFATSVEALKLNGVMETERQLMMIRGWDTSTLIIKNGQITQQEIQQLQAFCAQRSFDLVYYPGITDQDVNRFNILSEPYFYQGVSALLGDQPEVFINQYKFDIRPATDDRPYFFNYFKWSIMPEIVSLYRQGGFSLLELGYPILLLTLLQAGVVSVVLILLPLKLLRQETQSRRFVSQWQVLVYFAAIGLGYLFIEIAFIQKFILFLAHPVYSIATVLCGFLIFSGVGSLYAQYRISQNRHTPIYRIVLLLGMLCVGYLWLLPLIFNGFIGLSMGVKILLVLCLIAPLAFCMGMPFPLGLSQLSQWQPNWIPWAWGVNGYASLISAVLATLLAVHFGFTWVMLLAVAFYVVAALINLLSVSQAKAHSTTA